MRSRESPHPDAEAREPRTFGVSSSATGWLPRSPLSRLERWLAASWLSDSRWGLTCGRSGLVEPAGLKPLADLVVVLVIYAIGLQTTSRFVRVCGANGGPSRRRRGRVRLTGGHCHTRRSIRCRSRMTNVAQLLPLLLTASRRKLLEYAQNEVSRKIPAQTTLNCLTTDTNTVKPGREHTDSEHCRKIDATAAARLDSRRRCCPHQAK